MFVRVVCAGVTVGTADLEPAAGLAHGPVRPTRGYALAAPHAQVLGRQFTHTQFWSPVAGDFADDAAARWPGGRLALQDVDGRELGVSNVVLLDYSEAAAELGIVRLVADFRADVSRVEALLRPYNRGGGGSSRPAA